MARCCSCSLATAAPHGAERNETSADGEEKENQTQKKELSVPIGEQQHGAVLCAWGWLQPSLRKGFSSDYYYF